MSEPQKYNDLRRHDIPNHAHSLNFACFHNLPLLKSDRACQWLADAIIRALPRHECDVWAYCFMPTHAHLLAYPRSKEPDMAAFIESIKKSVNRRALTWLRTHKPDYLPRLLDEQPSGRSSHRFWQRGGGYDRNLWSPRHIWNMIDYIHHNPVEAGLCTRSIDWPWSSAPWHYTRTPGPLPIDPTHLPPDPRHL